MPSSVQELESLSNNWSRFTRLKGVVAAADGCHFPIRLPVGGENEFYYNFKGWYSLLGVFLVDSQSKILGMSLGYPGKLDDSSIVCIINLDQENRILGFHSQSSRGLLYYWGWGI